VTVADNDSNAREHAFAFAGQARVRLVIDAAAGGHLHLIELEAHDVSNGSEDTWLFLGDSITAMAMNRYVAPDLATRIHEARPAFTPMVIDDAIGGTQTTSATSPDPDAGNRVPIDTWIARYPDIRNVVVAYGTNDAGCDTTGEGVPPYIERLGVIVDKLTAAGKRVVIPHIPWNTWRGCQPTALPPYNAAIDRLIAARGLFPGPDLYSYFAAHHGELSDGVHPDDKGTAAMNRLYADAVLPLYP
jgi:acyl-CoA thioesterase-1